MIPQSRHNGLKGERGERLVSHFVFCMTGEIWLFACQKGNSEGHGRDGGNRACLLSNFAAFIQAVKSNNQEIMQPRFVNYKRVRRSTKGFDRCHLSPVGSAVWLYHQRGNITFWCLHKRSISISQDVIPFTSPSHRGLTPPKNPQSFFKSEQNKKKKGAEKHPRWSSVHF